MGRGAAGHAGQAGQQGAFVSQEFITAHKRQLRQGVAEQQIAAAEQQWAAQQFRVLSDVRVLCYRILIAEQRIEVLEQLLSVAERAVNRAQILLRGGEGPRSDYLEAQIVAERNRLELQRAHLRKEQLWRALAAVVGVPAIDPPQLVGTLDDALPRLDWDETRNRLISSSPLLTVAAAEVERTWREVELARAEVVPNVDLSLSVQRDNATRDTIASVTAGLPLPLWNRNQGEIRRAAAENVAAHENLRRLELNLQRQLSEEFLNYQNSRLSADRFAVTILPQARQNVELDLRGFEAGEVSYLELFTAQRILYQANLDYIDSLEQLWTSVQRIDNLLLGGSLAPPQADFSPGQ